MKQMKSVREFEEYLKSEHRAAGTIRAYTLAVRQYIRDFHTFTASGLDRYKSMLISRYMPQTVNQRICAVNQYILFMRENGDADTAALFSSLKCLKQIKLQQKFYLENVISDSDFNYLKKRLLADGNRRWYFILRLMTATGARVSELVQMKYEHLEAGAMDICSKAGKTRRILIPRDLCKEAMDYYRSEGITSGFIILNHRGQVITPRGIGAMLKQFAVYYKMNERTMHPHAFRHLYAQNFLKKCPDISLLADLLGHDSIETTRVYLKKTGAEQKKLIDKVVTW
ncbi:MAG: tyrosine-type recombinase/integrase [Eubacteriales bacterium]|nr:tyrosine-type recombinase/integrase [Eubacteriales bacterium]